MTYMACQAVLIINKNLELNVKCVKDLKIELPKEKYKSLIR
jgi:hypothetical protein